MRQEEKENRRGGDRLLQLPVYALLWHLSVPVGIGFLFHTMFNLVDIYFAGRVSNEALASMSLSFPLFFVVIAVGSGLATGTNALISNAQGAGDELLAREYAVHGILAAMFFGLLLSIVGPAGAGFIFRYLGAEGDFLALANSYMTVLLEGSVLFIMVLLLNSILNATGDTRSFRNFLMLGFLLNLVLDPWLIKGGFGIPAMGLAGIALATVVIEAGGCFYLARKTLSTRLMTSGSSFRYQLKAHVLKEICFHGCIAAMGFLSISAGFLIVNYCVSKFGVKAVAAYGVGLRVEQIFLLPCVGLNTAVLTLVGHARGARNHSRVCEVVAKARYCGLVIMMIGMALIFCWGRSFVAFFAKDPEVVATGVEYLNVAALISCAYMMVMINSNAFQGLRLPRVALVINLLRHIILPAVAIPLISGFFGYALLGVWYGVLISQWVVCGLSFFLLTRVLEREGDARGCPA